MEGETPQIVNAESEPWPPLVIVPAPVVVVPAWVRVLAGIETGVLGAALMSAWLFSHSWWTGEGILTPANIWATTMFGGSVMRYGPAHPYSGIAVHFLMACLLSAVFSLVCGRVRRFPVVLLLGLFTAIVWYFLLVSWNRWIAVYSQQPETFLAYLLFGVVLSRAVSRSAHLAGVLASTN
jgi:hypothetical protein